MDQKEDRTTTNKIQEEIKCKRTVPALACPRETNPYSMPCSAWSFTFMRMNIPIARWIYLPHLVFGKKENQLRDSAKAYLIYKLIFLVIALVLFRITARIGLDLADKVLAYMEML